MAGCDNRRLVSPGRRTEEGLRKTLDSSILQTSGSEIVPVQASSGLAGEGQSINFAPKNRLEQSNQGTGIMNVLQRRSLSGLNKYLACIVSQMLVVGGCACGLGCPTVPPVSELPFQVTGNSNPALSDAVERIEKANSRTLKAQEPVGDPATVTASQETAPGSQATPGEIDRLLLRKTTKAGIDYLLAKGQADDGSFSKQLSPAVTALCTSALIAHRVPLSEARVQKALKYLESKIQPDGGIYADGSNLRNYETSVSLMCFNQANVGGKYDETIQKAISFLKGLQWDDAEGHTIDSTFYGGQGYGSHKRPDASNTSFFLDALKSVAEDPESEAFQKAATFMSRCQNLSTPHNTAQWASRVSADDRGGFVYSAVGEGESKAGETPEGGLRSYASMTYAGLKSMLYAGVDHGDIRVKAAKDWIGRHYDLTSNPGMGQQGLFYYYHVFAKTLDASGDEFVKDAEGNLHNWRADLVRRMSELQREDGSWTNPADRWFEGDPNLVSAYALLALGYCDNASAGRSRK